MFEEKRRTRPCRETYRRAGQPLVHLYVVAGAVSPCSRYFPWWVGEDGAAPGMGVFSGLAKWGHGRAGASIHQWAIERIAFNLEPRWICDDCTLVYWKISSASGASQENGTLAPIRKLIFADFSKRKLIFAGFSKGPEHDMIAKARITARLTLWIFKSPESHV